MDNTKLSTLQAVSIILTITFSQSILTFPKAIMSVSGSSSLLNILYVGIIAFVLCVLIYKLFNKFPGLDLIDISEILGGKLFQKIIGFLFIAYIVFVSSILLRTFAYCLQVVYYPMTDLIFIIAIFAASIPIACNMKYNAIFKATLALIPIVLFSVVFLFIANAKYFNLQNVFPLLGNGINATFGIGVTNIFAFGGITALYLIPPLLKSHKQFKKVSLISITLSVIYFILSIATILLMFNQESFKNELMPLYSAVRYIEFGTFFQRLDSIFLLIWVLASFCSLGVAYKLCINVFKKITNTKNTNIISYPFALLVLGCSLLPKTEAVTNFLESTVYRYVFLCFAIAVPIIILILASIKAKRINIKE